VTALAVHDDGSGAALYAGGSFTTAGGAAANRIARWDGSAWTPLGGGMNGEVLALAVHDDGSGTALYAGGTFSSATDSGDSFLARWGCDTVSPVIHLPSTVHVLERLGSSPGEVVVFSITASDDQDSSPSIVCEPPSGSFLRRGTTLVTCTATDDSGNESSSQFPVLVTLKTTRP
jgi:hypothetical protein